MESSLPQSPPVPPAAPVPPPLIVVEQHQQDMMEQQRQREQQEQQSHDKRRRQRFWILVALFNTVLLIAVVILVVTRPTGEDESSLSEAERLAMQQQQEEMTNQPSAIPTISPTINSRPTGNPTMNPTSTMSHSPNSTDQEHTPFPGGSHDDNDDDEDNDQGPIQEPTTTDEFLADLLLALKLEPSYLGTLPADTSYLGQALQWMLLEDQQYYPIGRTMPNILLERFLLAAMYFATGGPNWKYEWEGEDRSSLSLNFLKNTSVCEWVGDDYMDDQGVFCNEAENSRVTEVHGTCHMV
jgi:hypothetical protein